MIRIYVCHQSFDDAVSEISHRFLQFFFHGVGDIIFFGENIIESEPRNLSPDKIKYESFYLMFRIMQSIARFENFIFEHSVLNGDQNIYENVIQSFGFNGNIQLMNSER